jgi:hypothetical protein
MPERLFSLYLRQFDITGKVHVEKAPANLFSWEQYDRPGQDALERLCADAVRQTAPLIGLGDRGEIEYGFGSAGLIEDDWKEKISKVMTTAAYIFIIPSANAGTLWEIGEVKRKQLFWKTVVIMPPSSGAFSYAEEHGYKGVWEHASVACFREHGTKLPEYAASGALLRLDDISSIWYRRDLDNPDPRAIAKAINELMGQGSIWSRAFRNLLSSRN